MTVYTKDIIDGLTFRELSSKNLHTENIVDHFDFIQTARTQHKFLTITERIQFVDMARRVGGIRNLIINQSLSLVQQTQPRITNLDVADLIVFTEFLNRSILIDSIIFGEGLTVEKVKALYENFVILETLSTKIRRNLVIHEVINIHEGLSGYIINDTTGASRSFVSPFCSFPPAIIFGIPMQEVPAGTINGVNRVFTLSYIPQTNSLLLYVNGLFQRNGVDYTIVDLTITFVVGAEPKTGENVVAYYIR